MRSGFLTSYEGLPQKRKGGAFQRRDDAASNAVERVYIAPAVLAPGLSTRLSAEEQSMVLHEVDRQICFEVSKRFAIAPAPEEAAGTIRTAIVRLQSASRIGSAASAVGNFFSPIPVAKFRIPMASGGLAVESELLASGGSQVAAVLWNRSVAPVGRTRPSLSRAGDALQLSEPLGDAVARAYATKDRPKIEIGEQDPCKRFGSRKNIARSLASGVLGFGTGLYMPQVAGTNVRREEAERPD